MKPEEYLEQNPLPEDVAKFIFDRSHDYYADNLYLAINSWKKEGWIIKSELQKARDKYWEKFNSNCSDEEVYGYANNYIKEFEKEMKG